MKKLFCIFLVLCMLLSGCNTAPEVQDTAQDNVQTPQQFVTDDTQQPMQDSVLQPQQFVKKTVVDGVEYQSVSDPLGYDFDITRNSQSLLKDTELIGEQLSDWQVCDEGLLFQTNICLYRYNLTDGTIDLVLNDVSHFDYYDGYIYFTEHASRTFTVYKMQIGSDKKEVVIGHDVYDRENPKELVSNFVITDDGDIVFTQRVPYGLYVYKNGKHELLLQTQDINENSLCADGNNVYFVLSKDNKTTLYSYTEDNEIKELCELDGYQNFLFVQDGKCSYLSTEREIIEKSLN